MEPGRGRGSLEGALLLLDTPVAAERLGVVARVFEAPTREWLERHRPEKVDLAYDLGCDLAYDLAYDLGCGPGHTTAPFAEVRGARRVVGLDAPGAFAEVCEGAFSTSGRSSGSPPSSPGCGRRRKPGRSSRTCTRWPARRREAGAGPPGT